MNRHTTLVLGGGNALGAYHAGAYEALSSRGVKIDWIVGASAGAIAGAIIAGNPPERRLERLRSFWSAAQRWSPVIPYFERQRQSLNGFQAALTALLGQPTIFRHRLPGFLSALPGFPNDIALYDHAPLRETLAQLVDFDRMNGGDIRLSVNTVDITSGEEIVFDTMRGRIEADHIMASSAITPGFPPVTIGGRLLCDPGYTNNTPIDIALQQPPSSETLCIAVELFDLASPAPKSLDAVLERTQDIMFASPTRRTIAALGREYDLRAKANEPLAAVTLLHVVYQQQPHEISMKTLDFSARSIADRWAAGFEATCRGLDRVDRLQVTSGFNYLRATDVVPRS